jgi:quinol monooxygenase YgiN
LGVFKSPLKLTLFMVTVGLQVRLEAKPGKEQVVADFLKSALPLAQNEPAAGRQAHLNGPIAAALMANAADLLASDPVIEMVDILAAK